MKHNILILVICMVFYCCKKNNVEEEKVTMNQPSRDISIVKSEVFSGKIDAYKELSTIYLDYDSSDFLYYAMLMANKNDYAPAFLDVYDCLNDGTLTFKERDKRTQKIMMEYLNEAVKRNVEGAKDKLKEINSQKKREVDSGQAKG